MMLEDFYSHLKLINGVAFTSREVDVIACILAGRKAKKIAILLSIAPRTVETHIYNIMQKSGCSYQDTVIDFIEKSGKMTFFKKHYSNIIIQNAFESELKKMSEFASKIADKQTLHCLIIRDKEDNDAALLANRLREDLKSIGITTGNKANKIYQEHIFSIEEGNYQLDDVVICLLPKEQIEQFKITRKALEEESERGKSKSNRLIFLGEIERIPEFPSTEYFTFDYIHITSQKNYYLIFFEILKKILPEINFSKYLEEFQKRYSAISDPISLGMEKECTKEEMVGKYELFKWCNSLINLLKKNGKLSMNVATFCLAIVCGLWFVFSMGTITKSPEPYSVQSDLVIPNDSFLLNRPKLLTEIDSKLKKQNKIKMVAIVGPGGAGKTTLTRQYAKSQKASVIWEINAENKESLGGSFKNLAYALAKTKDQKDELDFIQKIQNYEDKEKQIFSFVKQRLKESSNWILIYDNAEELSEVKDYFPQDPKVWGYGKVIITTREGNIENTNYMKPNNIVQLEELTQLDALTLFCKIMHRIDPNTLSQSQMEETSAFLKNIPQFPLDVSLAAYYIKNSQISFNQYLERISQYSSNFVNAQTSFLKRIGDYTKTRYGIVTSSFENLISGDQPEFKELLFLTCLLDSQKVPREFLESYKNPSVVDHFFQNLNKYSLITYESSTGDHVSTDAFSVHRSTQMLGKTYFSRMLTKKEIEDNFIAIVSSVKAYYNVHAKQNPQKIIALIPHLEVLLRNINNFDFPQKIKTQCKLDLYFVLGYSYYVGLKNFFAASRYFSLVLQDALSSSYFSQLTLAVLLKDMGNMAIKLCDLDQTYSEQSIRLCRNIPDSDLIIAENLQAIGATYRKKDKFEEAHRYLMLALEKLSNIEREKKQELESLIYNQLGWLFSVNFIHNDKEQQAKKYFLESLRSLDASDLLHNEATPEKKLSCLVSQNRCRLGVVNIRLGNYEEALNEGLLEAEYIKKKALDNCPNDISMKGQILEGFAELYLRKGDVAAAEQKLTEAIKIFETIVGKTPSLAPKSLRVEARIRQGKLDDAYDECIEILQLNNREQNNYHNLVYLTNHYQAAIIKYKQQDFKKSLEHFAEFIKGIKPFCKVFLDEKTYIELEKNRLFDIIVLGDNQFKFKKAVDAYLNNSAQILTEIYGGPEHPFIKDYVLKNLLSSSLWTRQELLQMSQVEGVP